MNNQKITDYIALAETSYADFTGADFFDKDSVNPAIIRTNKSGGDKGNESDRTPAFAKYITNHYTVVAHYTDRLGTGFGEDGPGNIVRHSGESGFSATLFREGETGKESPNPPKYILAMRGTWGFKDVAADIGDIVRDGAAYEQIIDMYNFYQQLKAEKGKTYRAAKAETDIGLSVAYSAAIAAGPLATKAFEDKLRGKGYFIDGKPDGHNRALVKKISFVDSGERYAAGDERVQGLGILSGHEKLIVSGHSLGGHLAAAFSRLFPDATEHAYLVNGAGFGNQYSITGSSLTSIPFNIAELFGALGGVGEFDKNKITNFIGDKNFNIVAQNFKAGLVQAGKTIDTFIESGMGNNSTFGHGSGQLSDTMLVSSLFFALDGKLNRLGIDKAISVLNPIYQAMGNDDTDALEQAVYALGKILGVPVPENKGKDRDVLYRGIWDILTKLESSGTAGKYSVESLLLDGSKYDAARPVAEQVYDLAKQNSPTGFAYRYALRELNPFAVIGADYSAHQQKGNLSLYSPDTPNGMTEDYIKQRIQMLAWKNAFDLSNISYDERFGAINLANLSKHPSGALSTDAVVDTVIDETASSSILSLLPANIEDDWVYEDTALGLKLDIDGRNPTDLSRHYIRFGGNAEGNLSGGDLEDRLFGDDRDNTLAGNQGNDHMEGGIGFDTYYIEDGDTVVDSDGKGKIIFRESGLASATLPAVQAGHFVRSEGETEMWNSADENGKTDNRLTARKIGNDLEIWRSNSINDKVLIKNFFRQASAANNGSLSLLGISLADAVPTEERPFLDTVAYAGEANLYNTFNLSGQQRFNIIGGSRDDLVFANGAQAARIDAGAGNDRIYGSYGADTIYGGAGSDYINGSPGVIAGTNRTAEQQAEDRDFLVGGAGRDVVVGMAGDDIIHTGEVGEHLLTIGSGEAGDLASGGLGDDKIYGSIANDLLAGSEGGDTVYGGAGDDVILGDALYRLASRSLTVYREGTITGPEYGPGFGIGGIGHVTPPSHYTPRVGAEHNYLNGKWEHQVTNAASRSHPDMDKWTVSIDREKGDYAFSSPIPAINEDHRLAAGGGADHLYGGYGNDLIIGQDGNDFLYGEAGTDILWGDDNRDPSVVGDDYLDGGDDNDTLYGGGGTDTLIGGRGSDTLYGGTGFDTYLFNEADLKYGNDIDTIDDEDGQGRIVIDGTALDGLTWQRQDGGWRSGRFSLSQTGSELHVAVDGWQNGIAVRNFANGTLGLNLPAGQPETPTNPDNPGLPETPINPTNPDNPGLPETPINPTNPDNPGLPETPINPTNPDNPGLSETPINPTNPDSSGLPETPVLPKPPANRRAATGARYGSRRTRPLAAADAGTPEALPQHPDRRAATGASHGSRRSKPLVVNSGEGARQSLSLIHAMAAFGHTEGTASGTPVATVSDPILMLAPPAA